MSHIEACRLCGARRLEHIIDFGMQPLANNLLSSPEDNEDVYPLHLVFCQGCGLLQLDYTVDPEVLFRNYLWVSGTSLRTRLYAQTFCHNVEQHTHKKPLFVVEAASNDGTFLMPFKDRGHRILGVDPARNLAEQATKDGILTIPDFLTKKTGGELYDKYGIADVVIARNVLPHVDPMDFIQGLRRLMDIDSLLVLEVHYAGDIYEELQYDAVYHEHLSYFTLGSIERLLNQNGLYVSDLLRSPISGGSLVVYARCSPEPPSDNVLTLRDIEARKMLANVESWRYFADRVQQHRQLFHDLMLAIQRTHKVIGYGASARSSTLLNYTDIRPDCIIDQSTFKQGKFAPGTRCPILHPDDGMARNPDAILLLAWNFRDEITRMLQERYHYSKGFIYPFPYTPHMPNLGEES